MARRLQGLEQKLELPHIVDYMHPRLVPSPPVGPGWLHEIKYDGYRVQVRVERSRATLRTRNGLDWTEKFPGLMAMAGELDDCLIDGELCALGDDGQPHFSALRSAIARRETDDLVLFVFDCLFKGTTDMRPFALESRKAVLRQLLDGGGEAISDHIRYVDGFEEDPERLFRAACELGLEGIVSKRKGEDYKAGRSDLWRKVKCRPAVEVVIGGWRQKGGRFSSIIAGVPTPDGGLRYAGRVHSGYSTENSIELLKALRPLEVPRHAFTSGDVPRKTMEIHWVKPELVADIELEEFTSGGKVRQGAFKRLRPDKSPADLNPEGY